MVQQFKSPIEQSNALIQNKIQPFNTRSISQKKHETPRDLFDGYRITQMSPNDYYKFVAHVSGYDPQKLIKNRQDVANEISVNDIRKKMREGVQFDTPWIRLMDRGEPGTVRPYWQEGLHRMLAAGQEYGMDTKFPVYIGYENDPWNEIDSMSMDDFIKHYDETRLSRYNKQKQQEEQQELEDQEYWKREAASHFKVPVDQVTPEQVEKYQKYLDWLFRDEWKD